MDGGVSLPDNALRQSRCRSFTRSFILGFKALGCVWMDAVSGAVHLPQQPVGIFVHARAFPHVLQVVTACLRPVCPKMREKEILEEALHCFARRHKGLGPRVGMEDFVGDVNFLLQGCEGGPHVGAAEPPLMGNLFRRWNTRDVTGIHCPDFASACPMPVSSLCFVVSAEG